jgi:hypothetical protein
MKAAYLRLPRSFYPEAGIGWKGSSAKPRLLIFTAISTYWSEDRLQLVGKWRFKHRIDPDRIMSGAFQKPVEILRDAGKSLFLR